MLITAARSAEQLVPAIDALTAQISMVNVAISSSFAITGGNIVITDPNNVEPDGSFTITGLTPAESNTVFNSMLTILNNRLSIYNAQLAAL